MNIGPSAVPGARKSACRAATSVRADAASAFSFRSHRERRLDCLDVNPTGHDDISLVVPTYNRANALRTNLDSMLALQDIVEIVIVDDGSTDDTVQACGEFEDKRLRVVSHESNRGVAAARNTGVQAAKGEWILFGEDDCRFPSDYGTILLAEANRHRVDVVGAPLIHTGENEADVARVAENAPRSERPSMEDVDIFPREAFETPFVPARALVRRSIFDRVSFYNGFLVNGYREETDFFVQAARAGFRCLFTPATYCYQLQTWRGGQHHSSTLRYEYWALRNNWRFLSRHNDWLVEQGYISGRLRAQLKFARLRGETVLHGALSARRERLRTKLAGRRGGQRTGS
jgi:glycosyltransferase involved in cell wall biosynthesis